MPENNSDRMIKFAAQGKPAKFGDQFGDLMKDKVNAGVEAIRAKVAAKLGGLDPTGEKGDGAEEGGNKDSTPEEDTEIELTPEEEKALDAEEPTKATGEPTDENSEPNT
jgi:hypothetical protein